VATHLRSGRIFSGSIITNFLVILTVKKFEKWSIFDEGKTYKNSAFFCATLYIVSSGALHSTNSLTQSYG